MKLQADHMRDWQRRATAQYLETMPTDFLAQVTPGGGKTRWALDLFLRMDCAKLIVVCSSKVIKAQWQAEAAALGFTLGEFPSTGGEGMAMTYQQVIVKSDVLQAYCKSTRALVILDEVHHAGDKFEWGMKVRNAFSEVACRLCLTGTAFRSDLGPIAFLRYDDEGFCEADFVYSHAEAVRDGVCRPIEFLTFGGSVEWRHREEMKSASISDDGAKLRMALSAGGGFCREILQAADADVGPGEAGLVLCIDGEHAREVALVLSEITGKMPLVVLHDIPDSANQIRDFRNSSDRWIVAVKMVSEGVDIPRLRVLVYLTNTCTPVFFSQAAGRICRGKGTARFYIPEHPSVLAVRELAEKFCSSQYQIKTSETPIERNNPRKTGEAHAELEFVGSDGFFRRIISAAEVYPPQECQQSMDFLESAERVPDELPPGIWIRDKLKMGLGVSLEVTDAAAQKALIEELTARGFSCKATSIPIGKPIYWISFTDQDGTMQSEEIGSSYTSAEMILDQRKTKVSQMEAHYVDCLKKRGWVCNREESPDTMIVSVLVATLESRGVIFHLVDGKVHVKAPSLTITDQDRQVIHQHKAAILQLLLERNNQIVDRNYSLTEAAEHLGISVKSVRRYVANGQLNGVQTPRGLRVESLSLTYLTNAVSDRIADELRSTPGGLTRTEIYSNVFKSNKSSAEISQALKFLASQGLASKETSRIGSEKNPTERWFAKKDQATPDLILSSPSNPDLRRLLDKTIDLKDDSGVFSRAELRNKVRNSKKGRYSDEKNLTRDLDTLVQDGWIKLSPTQKTGSRKVCFQVLPGASIS